MRQSIRGDCTFTKAKSRCKVPQTSKEQESYQTKEASNLGRAEPGWSLGSSAKPSSSSASGQAELPPARPGSTVYSSDDLILPTIIQDPISTVSRPFRQWIQHIIAPMKARLEWSHQWGRSPIGNPH